MTETDEKYLKYLTYAQLELAKATPNNFKLLNTKVTDMGILFMFANNYYSQYILVKNHEIVEARCDGYYCNYHECNHIPVIIYRYYDILINTNESDIYRKESLDIINKLKYQIIKPKKVLKQCYIKIDIKCDGYDTKLNLKLGIDKYYVLRTKAYSFFNSYYYSSSNVFFGKNFTYNPNEYYFDESDQELIELANSVYNDELNTEFIIDNYNFKQILKTNREFTINGKYVEGVYEYNRETALNKNNNEYIVEFDLDMIKTIPITKDFEYIYCENKVYHLNKEYQKLISILYDYKLNKLNFNDLKDFSQTILPIVRNEIKVDENIKDLVIVKKPLTKLYFDLNYNDISLDIKFDYKGNIYSYFEKISEGVLRDKEFEDEVKLEMLQYGFIEKSNKLILNEEDAIAEFIDKKVERLSDKYEVFTTEKLKQLNIVKNAHIQSNFSIGKDNIMKFDFELEDISTNELVNIFDSLKKKKRYYRLKSGNYLNLEDKSIRELEQLTNDLNLTNKEIKEGKGKIPKYQAIYLDSLNENKFNIIKTNNLFKKFVENFKNYQNCEINLDKKDEKILRDYQKIGVKWLYNLKKCDLGGILADEMGLGKSLQTICFIKQLLKEDKASKILIVTPTSLCYNWEKELLKFAPEIKYHVFTENRSYRHELLEKLEPNIYITSYGLVREDLELYKTKKFKVCIIDEAQNIKNPTAGITKAVKSIDAENKIALTGTPLENSLTELWSIFDFIMPGFLGNQLSFNQKYNVKNLDDDDDLNKINNLNKQISPFILRRKKKDVVKDLPEKIENNIYIDLSKEQKEIYAGLALKTKEEFEQIVNSEGFSSARFKILELLTRLRQVCIDPKIIYQNYQGSSSKIEETIKVIKELKENNHKMLLFSSFRTALEIVKNKLDENNISYYLIDGSVNSKKRMELVEKFNFDDTTVFLIMLKAGGTGLNLTGADVVIHLDLWWNPQVENQATDRVHRIGQKKVVEVIKLITKGTIEEKILELQQKKKQLADSIIEGENRNQNIINKLSEKDIRKLLEN